MELEIPLRRHLAIAELVLGDPMPKYLSAVRHVRLKAISASPRQNSEIDNGCSAGGNLECRL